MGIKAIEEQDCWLRHSSHETSGEIHRQGHFNQTSGGGAREEGQLRARHLRVGEAHRDRPGDQGSPQDLDMTNLCGTGIWCWKTLRTLNILLLPSSSKNI